MTIGVGIIGLSADQGAWAGVHFLALQSLPEHYKLVALATSSPESAAAAGKAYGVPPEKSYSPADGLVNDPDVQLVVVSVGIPAHKKLALLAINAGKDIYLEWPMGNGLEETIELVKAAKAKGVKAVVGLQGRHGPGPSKIKEIVDSGALGRIFSTSHVGTSNFWASLTPRMEAVADIKTGANLVTIFAGHSFDTILNILGEFKHLQASTVTNFEELPVLDADKKVLRHAKATAPDGLVVGGVLQNGATISWQLNTTTANNPNSLLWIIHGEKGTLKIEGEAPFLNIATPKISWFKDGKWQDVEAPAINPISSVARVYKAFAEGKTNEYVDFEQGEVRHRLLEAIWKSARDGTRESYL